MIGHINLGEAQRFPDPQEVTLEYDEGFLDSDMKIERAVEAGKHIIKQEISRGNYRRSSDESIG